VLTMTEQRTSFKDKTVSVSPNAHRLPLLPLLFNDCKVSSDLELSKVRQESKRFELLAILDDPDACHVDRLNLTRFLLGIGYDVEAVLEIIHCLNHWSDYSTNMTYNQVMSVAKWLQRNNNHISNSFTEGVLEETAFSKGVSSIIPQHRPDYEPIDCWIGKYHTTCYFKKCDSCKLKVTV